MRVDELFYFFRIDVFTAADYHIFKSARYAEIAVGISAGKVACVKPAVLVNRRRRRNRHFVIAFHNIVASCHKLSRYAVGTLFARFGVNYLTFYLGQRSAYR